MFKLSNANTSRYDNTMTSQLQWRSRSNISYDVVTAARWYQIHFSGFEQEHWHLFIFKLMLWTR